MIDTWTTTPAGTWLVDIRQELDLQAGIALDYVATLDAAYTLTGATLASEVDQGIAFALASTRTSTAPRVRLVAQMLEAGLTPRPGAKSRYTVRVVGAGEIPEGATVQGGGPLGRSRWTVVSETATYASDDPIVIEAEDLGPVSITSPAVLSMVTPATGILRLEYDSGDADFFAVGSLPESMPEMRARLQQPRAARGSPQGIRAELRDIPWIVAADVGGAAGVVSVTIAPAPVGEDREAELAAALLDTIPAGASTSGTSSVTGPDANGTDILYYYTPGTTSAVAVVLTIATNGTLTDADAIASATAAVQGVFAGLGNGDPLQRLAVLTGVGGVRGITVATLTLNGTSTDTVTPPTVADVLIASPLTVTVA